MPGATTQHPDGCMVTVYRLPAGTEMVVHRTAQAISGDYRPKDYVAIVSAKPVVYKDADVFLNPDTRVCTAFTEYGIHLSDYVQDNTHWGFRLPENAKGAAFLLVHHRYVTMTRELTFDTDQPMDRTISASQKKHLSDLMNKILKLDPDGKLLTEKYEQNNLYDVVVSRAQKYLQEDMAHALKKMDQKILDTLVPPTKGVIITP